MAIVIGKMSLARGVVGKWRFRSRQKAVLNILFQQVRLLMSLGFSIKVVLSNL